MKKFLKLICVLLVMVLLCTGCSSLKVTENFTDYINYRKSTNDMESLNNFSAKIKAGKEVNVVYFGGSVTKGVGASKDSETSWRAIVGKWFETTFPKAKVNNINSAIGGTSSFFGVYRLEQAVIDKKPDLLFLEFAINDYYDRAEMGKASMQFETIVRRVRKELPECDIVSVYTIDKNLVNNAKKGMLHIQALAHEAVCETYGIPAVYIGSALANQMPDNWTNDDWSKYVIDIVHPNDDGYKLYADVIIEFLNNSLAKKAKKVVKHTLPKQMNEQLLDGEITYIPADEELVKQSQSLGGDLFTVTKGGIYIDFDSYIRLDEKNGTLKLKFTGTELSLVEHGTDNFGVNISVDGGEKETKILSIIQPTVLLSGLENKEHIVEISAADTTASEDWIWIHGFYSRNK